MKKFYCTNDTIGKNSNWKIQRRNDVSGLLKVAVISIFMFLLTVTHLQAQFSAPWDGYTSVGTDSHIDYGNGVIQLLNSRVTACVASAVHETSSTYNPTSGTAFNKCYKVFFGCPGNDNIGSDQNGDGMAFSFWRSTDTYNIANGLACGGGLGYMGTVGDPTQSTTKMFTIEFDTWSSQGALNFDGFYGGGTSGDNDEIALQRDANASDNGRITSVNAGNLEDGLEHAVCINYDPATHKLTVTLDGNTILNYDLTGSPYDLPTYFGNVALNQTWSSAQNGAFNPASVSAGTGILSTIGHPLCPASVVITSPSSGSAFSLCDGPTNITASVIDPAGNTTSYVEFFVDGVSIGTDNTGPYSTTWTPTAGNHKITAVAHYAPSNTTTTSDVVSVSVSPGVQKTSSAPIIDGTIDGIWSNYAASPLTKVPIGAANISGPADLSATYQTMRDANNFYILVNVTDDIIRHTATNIWDNDGIEIFIDMGNTKSATYGANDFQYAFATGSSTVTEYKHNATTGVTFAQGAKTGGYIMEVSIPWATLGGAPATGDLIGFDVGVNDDDDGVRDSKIAWNDSTDQAHSSPSAFGTVKAADCAVCPTGTLSGNNTVCNGTTTRTLSVSLTGTAPWSFVYSIDGVSQPAVTGINSSPYTFQSATGAHTYALVSVSDAASSSCTGNTSGTATITVATVPTATLSGNNTVCDGTTTRTLSVSLTGTAPWSFVYAIDGVSQPAVTGINSSPYTFQSATGAHTYSLVSASDASVSACPATVSGTATITMATVPTATLSGNNTVCDGTTTRTLTVSLTGTAPWSFVYAIDGVSQPAVTGINSSPYTFQSATGTHSYSLVSASDGSVSACPATVSGTATITMGTIPTATLSGDNTVCGSAATSTLSVSLTGTAPWSLVYAIDGVSQPAVTGINSSPYTFQSATGAHSYALVSVSDASAGSCSGTVSGTATITMGTIPTATLSGDNTVCDGTTTRTLTVSLTGTAPWSFVYAIDGVSQPAITGINSSPYTFQSATGAHTYSLVSLSDASRPSCSGTVSGTAAITMATVPTAILSGDNTVCDASTTRTLSVSLTGTSPWSFVYAIDGVSQPAITGINSSPYTFQSATGVHTYTLVSVSDASTSGCAGSTTGTASISMGTVPTGTLSGNNTICGNASTSSLVVILNGTAPWSFTYSIDGSTTETVTGINTSNYIFQSGTGSHTYALVSVNDASVSGCTGSSSSGAASGTATITAITDIPVGHNGLFIAPDTAVLSVNNNGGVYQWYDAPVNGNLVFTGSVFVTPKITDTTTYYVQEASGAPCRVAVSAIPVAAPKVFFIPNLITPNSDGKNDQFEILGLPSGSSLMVFNRWGERIYENHNYDNLWAGNESSDGIYYFGLTLPDGKKYNGWVQILR
jgi:gliding motility-associated-like protein